MTKNPFQCDRSGCLGRRPTTDLTAKTAPITPTRAAGGTRTAGPVYTLGVGVRSMRNSMSRVDPASVTQGIEIMDRAHRSARM